MCYNNMTRRACLRHSSRKQVLLLLDSVKEEISHGGKGIFHLTRGLGQSFSMLVVWQALGKALTSLTDVHQETREACAHLMEAANGRPVPEPSTLLCYSVLVLLLHQSHRLSIVHHHTR
eukprot:TRINITY_DN129_c1_g1_i1.p1 TRINITY_DN129_c1_g1~~TRINITY_DN129_c1_g1_i1.p1  ORF type:complete len:119 (+),score=12.57 TRINITY_DN129_c1_g1_i1:105-461(+)